MAAPVLSSAPAASPRAALPPTAPLRPGAALGVLCRSASLGGLELNTLKFAAWMRERGWDVTLFAPPDAPLAEWAARWGVPLAPAPDRRGLGALPAAAALRRALAARGIGALVATRRADLTLAALAKAWPGRPLRLVYQQHMRLGGPKRDPFHAWQLGQLDAWLAPLPGLAQQAREWTRVPAARVHVVPLGLPLAQFAPGPDPAAARAAARRALCLLPAGGPLVGVLGRFDPGKGQDVAVRALHALRAAGAAPPGAAAELLLMGEPTRGEGDAYARRLHALTAELGLVGRVHFRPFRPDPADFYRALDVFVLASAEETYGMVTLEALAAGVPVVATAAGGTLELVRDGHTGLLFRPGDAAAAARALARCLADPAAAQARAARGREAVRAYAHERQCVLTEAVLAGLGVGS